jgi:phosphate starvation-inducible membrane PsiE
MNNIKVYPVIKAIVAFAVILLFSYFTTFAQKQGQARIDSIYSYLKNNSERGYQSCECIVRYFIYILFYQPSKRC